MLLFSSEFSQFIHDACFTARFDQVALCAQPAERLVALPHVVTEFADDALGCDLLVQIDMPEQADFQWMQVLYIDIHAVLTPVDTLYAEA